MNTTRIYALAHAAALASRGEARSSCSALETVAAEADIARAAALRAMDNLLGDLTRSAARLRAGAIAYDDSTYHARALTEAEGTVRVLGRILEAEFEEAHGFPLGRAIQVLANYSGEEPSPYRIPADLAGEMALAAAYVREERRAAKERAERQEAARLEEAAAAKATKAAARKARR